ncbi:MAG: hypothetical protein V4553_13100 [Bacteroidota bacterium]
MLKTVENSKVKQYTSHVDTGTVKTIDNVKTITTIHETDNTATETHITPMPGKPFIVYPNGTFRGEAKSVDTKAYKNHSKDKKKEEDEQTQVDEKRGISNHVKKDSSGNKNKETHIQQKSKDVIAKPNYNWILIVAAIIAFVLAVVGLYRKYLTH